MRTPKRQTLTRCSSPACSLGKLAAAPADELRYAGRKRAAKASNIMLGIDYACDALQPGNELRWALVPCQKTQSQMETFRIVPKNDEPRISGAQAPAKVQETCPAIRATTGNF